MSQLPPHVPPDTPAVTPPLSPADDSTIESLYQRLSLHLDKQHARTPGALLDHIATRPPGECRPVIE